MNKISLKSGDEYDALTRWKSFFHWRPGQRKKIKRAYNKRFRKESNMLLRNNKWQAL